MGVALPTSSVSQEALAEAAVACCCDDARQTKLLRELYRRSGVERRGCAILDGSHGKAPTTIDAAFPPRRNPSDRGPSLAARMAMYGAAAEPLAVRAATAALRHAGMDPGDVGHLVTVSCTGFAAPGVDLKLIHKLDLRTDISRTHVGFMGCHAALNGWETSDALAARSGQPALLVCVEVCTAHFAYGWAPNRLVANALFADGAAAAVLDPNHGDDQAKDGRPLPSMLARRSQVVPGSLDAMTWHIGDHGFEMTLSPRVPEHIRRHAGDALLAFLGTHGLRPDDLAGLIVHPGGPRVVRATTEALGLPASAAQASLYVLREHGNLSSPTVLAVLDRVLNASHRSHDQRKHWLVVAFGPGLALEAMLLQS
ncbi:MAG: type III polyketide synthase [Planctomycetota bacterium]